MSWYLPTCGEVCGSCSGPHFAARLHCHIGFVIDLLGVLLLIDRGWSIVLQTYGRSATYRRLRKVTGPTEGSPRPAEGPGERPADGLCY